MTNCLWCLFQMRPLTFVDGGEISVQIYGFHFASIVSNFIGFGLNLGLVEFFKVIQCPDFRWIWTKPHDTLGNVSYRITTFICTWKVVNTCKDSSYKDQYHIISIRLDA